VKQQRQADTDQQCQCVEEHQGRRVEAVREVMSDDSERDASPTLVLTWTAVPMAIPLVRLWSMSARPDATPTAGVYVVGVLVLGRFMHEQRASRVLECEESGREIDHRRYERHTCPAGQFRDLGGRSS